MGTMRAGQIVAPRRLEWIEVPLPDPGEGEILVKLEAGAICGSDLPFFLVEREHPALKGLELPFAPFYSLHELAGHVARSRSPRFAEGDRVLALPYGQAGLGEYFLSPADAAIPLPEGPAERLVLSQPLGTVVHACLKLPNLLGRTAVVVGQGPIGQFFTAMLRRMGVLRLVAVDLLPERLEVSRRMGATHTVCGGAKEVRETVQEITGGIGADLSVEAVGYPDTLELAGTLIRRGGILLAFGVPHRARFDFPFLEFFRREGRLINSVGPNIQHDFPIAVELIASGALDVGPLITHRFPLARAQDGFDLFADRRDGVIKAILLAGSGATG